MVERCPYKEEVTGSIPVPPTNIDLCKSIFTGPSFSLVRTPDCQSGGRGFKSRRPRHFYCSRRSVAGFEPATGGSEGGAPPSWGAYEGAGPLRRSRRGEHQGRAGDGAWFKSRRPRHLYGMPCRGIEPATGGSEVGLSPSWGAYEGARDARNNERHVCARRQARGFPRLRREASAPRRASTQARRRVGEPAGTVPTLFGPAIFSQYVSRSERL